MTKRDEILLMTDEELLRMCRIGFFKASGNGGQKRNKCSTAVRLDLTLPPENESPEAEYGAANGATELSVTDCSERSQFCNRRNALKKMRFKIALEARRFPPEKPERMDVALSNPAYFLWCARTIDAVDFFGTLRGAAEFLGVSPSKLEKLFRRDGALWQYISKIVAKRLEKSEK